MNSTEHLVSCLGEEAVEILIEIAKLTSKSNRFGISDRNVLNPTGPTNAERRVAELNDLIAVAEMLAVAGAIPRNWQSIEAQQEKVDKVKRFMEYAHGRGALDVIERARQQITHTSDGTEITVTFLPMLSVWTPPDIDPHTGEWVTLP